MFTYVMRFLFCLLTILPLSLYAAVGDHFYYADWYYEILSETDMTVANLAQDRLPHPDWFIQP